MRLDAQCRNIDASSKKEPAMSDDDVRDAFGGGSADVVIATISAIRAHFSRS